MKASVWKHVPLKMLMDQFEARAKRDPELRRIFIGALQGAVIDAMQENGLIKHRRKIGDDE